MESHSRDLENYVNVARHRRRRAKALLDFERHDDDELGFRKNDVITVSCKRSHSVEHICFKFLMINRTFAGDLAEGRALLGGRVERTAGLVSGKVRGVARRAEQVLLCGGR